MPSCGRRRWWVRADLSPRLPRAVAHETMRMVHAHGVLRWAPAQAVNLTIDAKLLDEARAEKLQLSAVAERALRAESRTSARNAGSGRTPRPFGTTTKSSSAKRLVDRQVPAFLMEQYRICRLKGAREGSDPDYVVILQRDLLSDIKTRSQLRSCRSARS